MKEDRKTIRDKITSRLLLVHTALLMFHRNGYVFRGIWDHIGTEPHFESLAAPLHSFVEEGNATIDYLYVRLTITDGREFVAGHNVLPIYTPFFILSCSVRPCTPPSLERELSKTCGAFSIRMTPLGPDKYVLHPRRTKIDWGFAIEPLRQKLVHRLANLYLVKSQMESGGHAFTMKRHRARNMLQARQRLLQVLRLMRNSSANWISETEGAHG